MIDEKKKVGNFSEKQRLKRIKKLFDRICAEFPDGSVNMAIHDITRSEIPRDIYELRHEIEGNKLVYSDKGRANNSFGIELFTEE